MKRVGLLGGTFNPPHAGHLRLAELACERLALDELRFVPAARSPFKAEGGPSPDVRVRLLKALLGDRPWPIEPYELDRGGTSYTVDTLEFLASRAPGNAWILLLGFDQVADFAAWHRPERIWELASIALAGRPGSEQELPAELQARVVPDWSGRPGELLLLPSTGLALSSSALREQLGRGETPAGLPPQVLAAIQAENLYR